MRYRVFHALIAALPLLAGCYHEQIRSDGNQARHALLDMYTDQAMDNLIRAHENLPFVQLSYHDLLVQATDQYTGSISNGQTFGATRNLTGIRGLLSTAMRSVGSALNYGGMAQRQDLLSFKADPVTDQNDIYVKYLTFANNPALFRSSATPPKQKVHLQRKYRGCYFYVPCAAAPVFLDLVLKTTLMRGQDAAPATSYEVTVLSSEVISKVDEGGEVDDRINASLHFSSKVPNGRGLLVIQLDDGRKVQLDVDFMTLDADGKRLPKGRPTDTLQAQWSPAEKGFGPLNLRNVKAQLFSNDYPPNLTAIDTTARQIKDNLDQIRANQSINTLRPPAM